MNRSGCLRCHAPLTYRFGRPRRYCDGPACQASRKRENSVAWRRRHGMRDRQAMFWEKYPNPTVRLPSQPIAPKVPERPELEDANRKSASGKGGRP